MIAGIGYYGAQGDGPFFRHISTMARYEAMFGDELNRVWDETVRTEASTYAKEFRAQDHNINANAEHLNVWRTTPMTSLKDINNIENSHTQIQNMDKILIPEPFVEIFKEVFGDGLGRIMDIMLAPTQKFSFEPPQLHTMTDLPAEEWYNFDWIGMIDGIIENHTSPNRETPASDVLKKIFQRGKELLGNNASPLEELKTKLAEILPESPSPKNTQEAFFWKELYATGLTPTGYYTTAVNWEFDKRKADLYKILGVDYYKAVENNDLALLSRIDMENKDAFSRLASEMLSLLDLGRGAHWIDEEIDPKQVSAGYYSAVTAIKQDPDYEKAFDESIPYEERESIRMMLDKRMRETIDAGWQKFLLELQQSVLMKEPLRAALAASA
ncbi:MAG: hypothetical protein AB7E49_06945 [Campylobacterales bacterium]